jgi:polyhydroxyalkanoate synthase
MDAALSISDHHAMELHARVERWALDEVPLPGKLVHEIGTLELKGSRVGPSSVSLPTFAVVNIADDVAPLGSIEPFINAMTTKDTRIIEYAGEFASSTSES